MSSSVPSSDWPSADSFSSALKRGRPIHTISATYCPGCRPWCAASDATLHVSSMPWKMRTTSSANSSVMPEMAEKASSLRKMGLVLGILAAAEKKKHPKRGVPT